MLAVVGNSHASQWMPTLLEIARTSGYQLVQVQAAGCPFLLHSVLPTCKAWEEAVLAYLRESEPDLVIVSNDVFGNQNNGDFFGIDPMLPGVAPDIDLAAVVPLYTRTLQELSASGLRTLIIRDTPAPVHESHGATPLSPTCYSVPSDRESPCTGARDRWEYADPAVEAAAAIDSDAVSVVDLNDLICQPRRCHAVVGGVVVRYDSSHLTATYARTLVPYLAPHIRRALAGPAS